VQQNLELERKEKEYAQTGKHNQDVQEELNVEMKRLESEREKMAAEKRWREQDVQKKIVSHAQKKRVEEAMLASERKKMDDRKKELDKKEKQASGTVRVPMYWKNMTGFHCVPSTFARAPLEKFIRESSCQIVSILLPRTQRWCRWSVSKTRVYGRCIRQGGT